jgi:hypothetical protein
LGQFRAGTLATQFRYSGNPWADFQGDDFRQGIRMLLSNVGFQRGIKFRRCLDDQRNLPIYVHGILPTID